jgi:hypothetical protein
VRLASPSDLTEVVKPFIFVDPFEADMGMMRSDTNFGTG